MGTIDLLELHARSLDRILKTKRIISSAPPSLAARLRCSRTLRGGRRRGEGPFYTQQLDKQLALSHKASNTPATEPWEGTQGGTKRSEPKR